MAHVLVVEDNRLVRTILREALEDDGHTVVEAADGYEGLALARLRLPDVIVTDFYMPNMSGDELTRMVRSSADLRDTPVIGLAGTQDSRQKLLEAGVTAYLPKPMQKSQLLSTVREMVDKKAPAPE